MNDPQAAVLLSSGMICSGHINVALNEQPNFPRYIVTRVVHQKEQAV